ncbi:MAG: class I SAM-dependent RNA methyltransferase [Actinomycetota bacterium]
MGGMDRRAVVTEIQPGAVGARGEGIGTDRRGRKVFVTGAIPGERVVARVLAERPTYLRARLEEVLEPSPFRTMPPCPELAHGCGGCQWQHIDPEGQRALKRGAIEQALRGLARVKQVPMQPTVALPDCGYRTVLRAAVSGGRAGYRRARGHTVVPVAGCLVAHPLLEDLLVRGRYGEATEVILRCGARTGDRLAAPDPGNADIAVPSDVQREAIREFAAGREWRISARSFFQSRPDGADALAQLVLTESGEPGTAVDLYSGVGLFAGVLSDAGWSVSAVEASAGAVADALVNLAGHPVIEADVARWAATPADLVVADPNRAGLGPEGVRAVAATGARRVILVSCDVQALGRDAGLLGRKWYSLSSVTPVDLFPHTYHVEVVSVFDR